MLPIAGILDISTIDYKGVLTAVVYTIGCNLRCPFCYNHTLLDTNQESMSLEEVRDKLIANTLIDGIVITGGEPTIHGDELINFLAYLSATFPKKSLKLDTNGTNPGVLERAIPYLDFVAMDIKTTYHLYRKILGVEEQSIKRSIKLLQDSGIDHEFRCTTVFPFVSPENIKTLKRMVHGEEITYNSAKLDSVLDPSFPMCNINLPTKE